MAVLTKLDQTEMRRDYFQQGIGKEHFKGTNPTWDGDAMLAVLQAIEDKWETDKVALKADMDVAAGVTMTNAQAKTLGRAWLLWKSKRGG